MGTFFAASGVKTNFWGQQVGLVAVYASTLPTRRRRELYAGFLRSLEDDGSRREALEQAKSHMPGDVPAILKKVAFALVLLV